MKRALPVLFASLATVACSSGAPRAQKVEIIQPELVFRQSVGPSDLNYPRGFLEVKYDVQVANRSAEPITVRRIEIQSDASGAYVIRKDRFLFDQKIDPDHFAVVSFWVRGLARGDSARGTAPVTIRGVVYFDSPVGAFHQFFIRELSQFPRKPGE
ncbi:MAG TPA: hypothetical protein VEZ11_11450 [Thermoanaerobaculia bacterium]|nr:hypothetical protein [Thermoanaerobaculia bacterium]